MAIKKSDFEKAAQQFGNYRESNKTLTVSPGGVRMVFTDCGDRITAAGRVDWGRDAMELPVTASTSVGDICRFIAMHMETFERQGLEPPGKLKGATSAGSFEDMISREGARLEKAGILTLGRYPVASVVIQGSSRPMQIPSKPDFEGVLGFTYGHGFNEIKIGQQIIFEAKVCSGPAFEIVKDKLKPKQVDHMLTRSKFNVPCFLLIHFNERSGATFYDPAFTVAIPVKTESMGGLPIWEQFVKDKGVYSGAFSRKEAREIGIDVPWHQPPRCKEVRPNLLSFLAPGYDND